MGSDLGYSPGLSLFFLHIAKIHLAILPKRQFFANFGCIFELPLLEKPPAPKPNQSSNPRKKGGKEKARIEGKRSARLSSLRPGNCEEEGEP
ncbi:MAG: hypothetical protein Q4D34_03965 [Eggerthellaceae bacterium]|nr:hypothetical protein [Eggerthellaceae bacterium]